MVFHSYSFMLVALPLCYAGFLLAHRLGGWTAAFRFLAVASLAFYAQWSLDAARDPARLGDAQLRASATLILRLAANRRLAGFVLICRNRRPISARSATSSTRTS